MTITIAVANQKGGVGKTSTTVNLAHTLASSHLEAAKRAGDPKANERRTVLVIDADPQANATDILGGDIDADSRTLLDVLAAVASGQADKGALAEAIQPASTAWHGIDLVPAQRELATRESDNSLGREFLLRTAMTGVTDRYETVIIDCPPSLGVLTVGALAAARQVLMVTEPRSSSAAGVAELMQTISIVRRHYNPDLVLAGIVINKWLKDRVDRVAWRRYLHDTYPDAMIDHPLPEREVVATAATNRVPVPRAEARDYVAAIEAVANQITH